MAFGPADRDGTNQNKDRTWKGPSVKLWVTAPAATFPLSPVHQTGITIINVQYAQTLPCGPGTGASADCTPRFQLDHLRQLTVASSTSSVCFVALFKAEYPVHRCLVPQWA